MMGKVHEEVIVLRCMLVYVHAPSREQVVVSGAGGQHSEAIDPVLALRVAERQNTCRYVGVGPTII